MLVFSACYSISFSVVLNFSEFWGAHAVQRRYTELFQKNGVYLILLNIIAETASKIILLVEDREGCQFGFLFSRYCGQKLKIIKEPDLKSQVNSSYFIIFNVLSQYQFLKSQPGNLLYSLFSQNRLATSSPFAV